MVAARIPKLLCKHFYFFSLQSVRMSGKNINFDDKKIKKKLILQKQKNISDR